MRMCIGQEQIPALSRNNNMYKNSPSSVPVAQTDEFNFHQDDIDLVIIIMASSNTKQIHFIKFKFSFIEKGMEDEAHID